MKDEQNILPDEQSQNSTADAQNDAGESIHHASVESESAPDSAEESLENISNNTVEEDQMTDTVSEEATEALSEDPMQTKEPEKEFTSEVETIPPEDIPAFEAEEQTKAEAPDAKTVADEALIASTVAKSAGVLILKPIHLAIASIIIAALIGGGIFLGILLGKGDSDIDKNAQDFEWVIPDGTQPNDDGITLPGYANLLLPADTRDVGILLPNPSQNPCHFRFTFTIVETGEVIYQSGLIPPGMAVKKIQLNRPLAKGDYHMEIRIDTTSVSDGTPLNGGTMTVLVQVR